jgi:hypothetical protein
MGEVAPSIEETRKEEVGDQPVMTSGNYRLKCQEDMATPTRDLRHLTANRRNSKQIWKIK